VVEKIIPKNLPLRRGEHGEEGFNHKERKGCKEEGTNHEGHEEHEGRHYSPQRHRRHREKITYHEEHEV
jgi:hypothetical protein